MSRMALNLAPSRYALIKNGVGKLCKMGQRYTANIKASQKIENQIKFLRSAGPFSLSSPRILSLDFNM